MLLGRSRGNARIFVSVLHGHDEQRRRRDIGHDAVGRRQSARRELGHLARGLPLFPARAPDRRIRREDPSGECRTELVGANSSLLSFWISPAPLVLAVHARKPFEVHDSALARSARVSESPSPGGANNPTIRGPSGGTDLDFCRRACFTPFTAIAGRDSPTPPGSSRKGGGPPIARRSADTARTPPPCGSRAWQGHGGSQHCGA